MNIGFVSEALPYLPSRGGFRLYGANLIRHLSRRHRIDLVSLLRDDDSEHLDWPRQFCASIKTVPVNGASPATRLLNLASAHLTGRLLYHRRELSDVLWESWRSCKWDVLHIEGAGAGALVPTDLPVPKILSLHDSWTLRCEEMLRCNLGARQKLYYTLLKYHEPRFERLLYPRFERCVVVAERDLEEVRRVVPNCKVDLIPYGTDTEYFHPLPVVKQESTMVFHGHLGYPPNIRAALEFARDIFPLIRREVPNVIFHLVAADPVPEITELVSRPGIKLSVNPPDVRPAVCSGRVYVCAIRYGTGMKNKMLEAMAMRLPIVCYPGSTVGLEGAPEKHYIVAQEPQDFADQVVRILRDPGRAEQIANAGRALVAERYSWESRACQLEALYRDAMEQRKQAASTRPAAA